jgi:hypothetical protein
LHLWWIWLLIARLAGRLGALVHTDWALWTTALAGRRVFPQLQVPCCR